MGGRVLQRVEVNSISVSVSGNVEVLRQIDQQTGEVVDAILQRVQLTGVLQADVQQLGEVSTGNDGRIVSGNQS